MLEATRPSTDSAETTDLISEWVAWMDVMRGLLPNTIRLYRRTVEEAHAQLGDLENQSTEALQAWIQKRAGKESTVSNRISALASFYKFLVKTKRRVDNPALDLDRPKRRKGIPKPVADLDAALAELDRYDAKVEGRRVGETRDMALFIAHTGLRISEACSVDLPVPAPERFPVIGKGGKERFVVLNKHAKPAIERLGGKIGIGPRAVQRRFERAEFHPHQLRHWRATDLVRKKVEIGTISVIMGHSSPAITMTYAQYDTGTITSALDL